MKHALLSCLCAALAAMPAMGAPAGWAVPDAPYRATLRLEGAPQHPDFGTLIDLPDFGQIRDDARDLLLVGPDGKNVPIKVVKHQPGTNILVLAADLQPRQDYALYFGGGKARNAPSWDPRVSLLMEIRKVPVNSVCESWAEMEKLWKDNRESEGAMFVKTIYQGENPFGESGGFASHFTGWLVPPAGGPAFLYTLSTDASFVLVNGSLAFDWPGRHLPLSNEKTVHGKEIPSTGEPLRIDYYQVKGSDPVPPVMVLGWKKDGKLETVPPSAWLRPWLTGIRKLEPAAQDPVPLAEITVESTLGYADHWYSLAGFKLGTPVPAGWTILWEFEDGTQATVPEGRHVFLGNKPQIVKVTLRSGNRTVTGLRRVVFPDSLSPASVNSAPQLQEYLDAMAAQDPAGMKPEALATRLALLLDFAKDGPGGALAEAQVRADPKFADPITLRAGLAWLRALAKTDPKRALAELRRLDPSLRDRHVEEFGGLETDLLVFSLRDPSAAARATTLASQRRGTDFERLMKIRAGDAARLSGQASQAVALYQAVTGTLDAKRLPAEDRAASIKTGHLLDTGHRDEALQKLTEWELRHPMTKFESDFLLLHARVLNAFGRNREALTELDSFEKNLPDDPLQIDAEYCRAEALAAMGQKEEAKKIWSDLASTYPRHPLAASARERSQKP